MDREATSEELHPKLWWLFVAMFGWVVIRAARSLVASAVGLFDGELVPIEEVANPLMGAFGLVLGVLPLVAAYLWLQEHRFAPSLIRLAAVATIVPIGLAYARWSPSSELVLMHVVPNALRVAVAVGLFALASRGRFDRSRAWEVVLLAIIGLFTVSDVLSLPIVIPMLLDAGWEALGGAVVPANLAVAVFGTLCVLGWRWCAVLVWFAQLLQELESLRFRLDLLDFTDSSVVFGNTPSSWAVAVMNAGLLVALAMAFVQTSKQRSAVVQ